MMSVTRIARELLIRKYCSTSRNFKVAVVGSGPAGFYTSQQILKGLPNVEIDLYERLPFPFGLVRYGVAPHHQDVKNCTNTFESILNDDRVSYFGNVTIGQDVSLPDLKEAYHAIVLSYGCHNGKPLHIQGTNLHNVFNAKEFVEWYNGHPYQSNLSVDLKVDSAVVIGHGNVALDVASMLLFPVEKLEATDTSEYALNEFRQSTIRNVYIIGRRGPMEVSFTTKELRDLSRIENCHLDVPLAEFSDLYTIIPDLQRPKRRLMELLQKTAAAKISEPKTKNCYILFRRSPTQIYPELSDSIKSSRVGSVELELNKLTDLNGRMVAVPTGVKEVIKCGLVISSIGYQGVNIENSLPFDAKAGVIENYGGRVKGMAGYYCSGWISHGATGVILHTMTKAHEVGQLVCQDLARYDLGKTEDFEGQKNILPKLKTSGINLLTKENWRDLDTIERSLGQAKGRPRVKILSYDEMINNKYI